ncbi:MAG: hypothetical protein HC800_01765 [Phormidesmis sp. RL_2_1]|nr:hypothetical protein [Phormidesmis sp. RL_2_1]
MNLASQDGEVRINLSLEGYPAQDFNLNVNTEPSKVRVVRLSESGQPDVQLKDSSELNQSGQPSPHELSPPTEILSDLKKGILFELESCAQEDDTLTCDVLLTDQRDNRELTVYVNNRHAKSRVIDVNATQTVPHHVYFGDRESRGYVTQPLVQDIPLKASLVFDKIQVQEDTVSLVEIGVYTQDDQFFSAQFKDVPITR